MSWRENGQMLKECDYTDDKKNGYYIKWNENGQKRRKM